LFEDGRKGKASEQHKKDEKGPQGIGAYQRWIGNHSHMIMWAQKYRFIIPKNAWTTSEIPGPRIFAKWQQAEANQTQHSSEQGNTSSNAREYYLHCNGLSTF
jgi:hypothetical protein